MTSTYFKIDPKTGQITTNVRSWMLTETTPTCGTNNICVVRVRAEDPSGRGTVAPD